MKRTLVLRREPLSELTVDELGAVVGGHALSGLSCPARDCLDMLTTRCNTTPWCAR